MCFTFEKNNKWTKKSVNCFLQDSASVGMQPLQTSIVIKLCQTPWIGLYVINSFSLLKRLTYQRAFSRQHHHLLELFIDAYVVCVYDYVGTVEFLFDEKSAL